jgi:Tol biopolymer transport system component
MILGTAGYMAPEQAKGRAVVDKRADIWAFGVVLWEMLTGRRLFEGDSVPETLAGVLKSTIDLAALPPHIPPAIRRLLRRCLERNPKNRLHDIADARIVLDEVASGRSGEAPATAPEPQTRKLLVSSLVAVALLVGLAVGGFFGRGTAPKATPLPSPSHTELEIVAPPNTLLVSGLSISPDGRRLAFVARGEDGRTALWVRPLDEPAAAMLPGTTDARYPFWAPDSKRIGFFAQSRLKVTDLLGGSPRTLAETGATTDARGGTWGADDRIVYAPTFVGSLFSVPVEGGAPGPATRLPEGSDMNTQRFPSFLPDGRRFVFYSSVGTGTEPGEIFLGRLGSPEVKRLGPATSAAVWAPPGYLLFVQGHELVARRFDEVREELDGDPIPLGISLPGSISVSGQRSLSASNQGTLVYRTDKRSATRLVWVDRAGEELATVSSEPDVWHYAPSLSPDGRRVAVSHYEPGSTSGAIWVHDLERGSAYPLTFGDNGDDTLPTWSPDAEEVAFASVRANAPSGIFRSRVGQPGHEEPWLESASYVSPLAWLPSGRGLLYQGADAKGGYSLWRWDGDDGEPTRLSPEGGYETGAVPSPDGAWIAFGSEATRRMEIYLRRLDDTDGSSTLRVSTEGGSFPRWRGDGRELFYLDGNGRIMAVAVEPGEPPQCGPPQPLFQARLEEAGDPQYDVTADGQRFLLNRTLMEDRVPVAVVQGWTARLGKRRTP